MVGTVSVYEPPHRIVFSWRSPEWQGPTEVEVRFTPQDQGTLVSLAHRGWDTAGVAAPERDGYDNGWVLVLARYAEASNL